MEKKVTRYPGTINVLHKGCWASDLSAYLVKTLGRKDLELFVFPRNVSQETYEAVALIRSREGKTIERKMRSSIMLYLLGHEVVRVIEHVNDLESAVIFYMTVLDAKLRGVIRLLPPTASIHQDIGMPVYDGVESVIAFYMSPSEFFSTIERITENRIPLQKFYGKQGYTKEWDLRDPIVWPEGIVDEPTFLFNIMVPEETLDEQKKSKLRDLLRAGREKFNELLDFVSENLPWIYPILRKIIELAQKGRRPYIS